MPPADCWLHPAARVGPSRIAGLGLFAVSPIPAGTVVSRLGGRLVSSAELRSLLAGPDYVDTITVAEDVHLVLPPGTDNGKANHSCDPNLWWTDAYTLAARRDIAADEELTNDYATSTSSPSFTMACACGAVVCRRLVTGEDWRRAELRQRYGRHWVPALLELLTADT